MGGLQRATDPDDHHVLTAAIRAGASAIVTMNLKDFPSAILDKFGVCAIHLDEFILDLADLESPVLECVAKEQRASLSNPPFSAEQFMTIIRRQCLPSVADFLQERIDLI